MGGSQVWKVLWDYHTKIENMLNRYTKGESQLLNPILDEIEVYSAVEDEVILPVIESVDQRLADAVADGNDRLKNICADIAGLEPGDPAEGKLVKRLAKQWDLQKSREQQNLFPLLKGTLSNENYEMARHAFTVRQELLAARGGRTPPGQYYIGLPTGGWSKGANRGW